MSISKAVSAAARDATAKGQWVISVAALVWTFSTFSAGAASVQLLSARDPSIALPSGGNGPSVAPVVTSDGRFVLFASAANNLATNGNSPPELNLYLRDRRSNATTLVTANYHGTGGGNGSSMNGSVSDDGRYVAFQSQASDLLAGNTSAVPNDIYVRDMWAGTNILVSVPTNGGWANAVCREPVMTPDGRYVVFISTATNLVGGDDNGAPDVFVRDILTGTTTRVSVGAQYYFGPIPYDNPSFMSSPVITPDGRYVAFASFANALGAPIKMGREDVYLRDLIAGATIWASTNGSTLATNASGFLHPRVSDDGQYVAFKSVSNSGGPALVFQFDSESGTTVVVSTNGAPAPNGSDDLYGPEMTADGRFIAYAALDAYTNAVAYSSIHLWDSWTGQDTVLSLAQDGSFPTNTISKAPVFSPDGHSMAFLSTATNLVTNAVSSGFHVYLRDLLTDTTELADADTNGFGPTDVDGTLPSVSYDGQFVTFSAADGSLVDGDTNGFPDVFLRDVRGGSTELVSQRDATVLTQSGAGFSSASQSSVTPDGRWVVFTSRAEDLVTNDFNGNQDVFVHDVLTGTNVLVSVGLDGNGALGGDSSSPLISADGRYVVFLSRATNLTANPANLYANLYRRDLLTGTMELVSIGTDETQPANGECTLPLMSQDGNIVVFVSRAANLAPGTPANSQVVFRRDMETGLTSAVAAVSPSTGAVDPPTMSADGRYIAYVVNTGGFYNLRVWDAQQSITIYTNSSYNAALVALSPNGAQLFYSGYFGPATGLQVYITDVHRQSIVLAFSTLGLPRSIAPTFGTWSADGRFFTFATNSFLPNTNNVRNVFLGDVQKGSVTLVSVNSNGFAANGPSDLPVISGDGHYVVFRSLATDIVPGITSTPNLIVFDRLSNSLAIAESLEWDWPSWISKPAISGTGKAIAFRGWQSTLVPGDLNHLSDVFATSLQPELAVDSDGDGIPDWWMVAYFGHPTGQAGDLSRAQDDADGDGMTNVQEYLAGTDPTNPISVLGIQIAAAVTGSGAELSWQAAPGRSYRIQYKNDLADPVWQDAPGSASVVGIQGSYVVPTDQPSAYYRVVAEL